MSGATSKGSQSCLGFHTLGEVRGRLTLGFQAGMVLTVILNLWQRDSGLPITGNPVFSRKRPPTVEHLLKLPNLPTESSSKCRLRPWWRRPGSIVLPYGGRQRLITR